MLTDPTPDDLVAVGDPFLRWHLGSTVRQLWLADGSWLAHVRGRRDHGVVGTGPAESQVRLLAEAVDVLVAAGTEEVRLSLAPEAYRSLPDTVTVEVRPACWEWMLTDRPPVTARDHRIRTLSTADHDDLAALLSAENPTHHARPGDPGVTAWLGARSAPDAGAGLVCAGALTTSGGGVPNLRAITTAAAYRGRGWGDVLTVALMHAGFARHEVVTLGLYSHNDVARRLYERLGFRRASRFASAPARLSGSGTA